MTFLGVVVGAKSFHRYLSNFHLKAKSLILMDFRKHPIEATKNCHSHRP